MARNTSSVPRLYADVPLSSGTGIDLDKEQAHYVGRVLRLKPGDDVHLFNGRDGEWRCAVAAIERNRVSLVVEEALDNNRESPRRVHLVQGISRGERMDLVMQKATELGVSRITPVLTDHGMVRLDDKRSEKRQLHWQSVANSACEQCGRIRPPDVDLPQPLNNWLGANLGGDSLKLILHTVGGKPLADYNPGEQALCLLVGPEGGFSEREMDDARVAGFHPASLGPRVLRTETAAISAITAAQFPWGDLG